MARRQNREQSPLSNPVAETSPNNLIREEPSYPNHKADRVAHRNEPQNLCELPIAQAPRSGYPRQAHAKKEIRQRSEEHTSELQSRLHLVCRLLLEKKK